MSTPATATTVLQLRVREAETLNPMIRMLTLEAADSAPLPGYSPGAHVRIKVQLPNGSRDWRHYSLIDWSPEPDSTAAPHAYRIAVRREDDGRGGSRFMHEQVHPGQMLEVESPANEFLLSALPTCAVLIAGGIGITPLVSMAARRIVEQAPVRLHYAGRSRSLMAFVPELEALLGDALHLHADDEAGAPIDVAALLDACAADDQLYVCGPKPLLDAVLEKTQARGWTRERVHFEVFSAPTSQAGDHTFEVVLAQSGQTLQVPADKSILDCLIDAGVDPMFDCQRGECGVCQVPVIEGEIEHRDYVLSDAEKASGKLMQICISRCKGSRLVLDL